MDVLFFKSEFVCRNDNLTPTNFDSVSYFSQTKRKQKRKCLKNDNVSFLSSSSNIYITQKSRQVSRKIIVYMNLDFEKVIHAEKKFIAKKNTLPRIFLSSLKFQTKYMCCIAYKKIQ